MKKIIPKFRYRYLDIFSEIEESIISNNKLILFSINLNCLYLYSKNKLFRSVYSCANIIRFDGFSAIIWAKLIGLEKKIEQIGADQLMKYLFIDCEEKGWSLYVLGGSESTEINFRNNVIQKYPKIKLLGHSNGYFSSNDEKEIIEKINNLSPDILMVGLSVPAEHIWVNKNYEKLKTKVIITCGAYIEQTSKSGVNYYPYNWINHLHLNWIYRIYKEPKRLWKRYFIQISWFFAWLPLQLLRFNKLYKNNDRETIN